LFQHHQLSKAEALRQQTNPNKIKYIPHGPQNKIVQVPAPHTTVYGTFYRLTGEE
jgi:hypothetical protein